MKVEQINPVTRARARGWVIRPDGYTGTNDAWLCGICGAIRFTSSALMAKHRRCKGGFALAVIREEKLS